MIKFRVPYPPSINAYWRSRVVAVKGRKPFVSTYATDEAKRFRVDVQAAILERFGVLRPTPDRVRVLITATMPDRRGRDIDNVLKASLDALTHARVWKDDVQVCDLRIIRGPVQAPGWLDVTIERLETEQQADLFRKG